MVDPSVGMLLGCGVNTQPQFMKFLPDAVPPCVGVSMAPKGFTALALSQVIVLTPNVTSFPSVSAAMAWILKVPLPPLGKKLVSII